ncbi:MAG: flagellar export chaperone FlgN [Oscillospiraceae bacterium]|nr:flagellar export chaperone FlgN [Oscillospiraceae bacterium]
MNNPENKTFINILNDTLKKKEEVLHSLAEATDKQSVLLDAAELDIDEFNKLVDEKEQLLTRLESLDDGFMSLYEKVRGELAENAGAYEEQVKETQRLIRAQTELSAALQAAEERNKAKMAIHLARGHQKMREFRVGSQTAAAYYRNMSGKHQDGESYFFNRKK